MKSHCCQPQSQDKVTKSLPDGVDPKAKQPVTKFLTSGANSKAKRMGTRSKPIIAKHSAKIMEYEVQYIPGLYGCTNLV